MLVKHNLSFLGQNSYFMEKYYFFIPFEMQTYCKPPREHPVLYSVVYIRFTLNQSFSFYCVFGLIVLFVISIRFQSVLIKFLSYCMSDLIPSLLFSLCSLMVFIFVVLFLIFDTTGFP